MPPPGGWGAPQSPPGPPNTSWGPAAGGGAYGEWDVDPSKLDWIERDVPEPESGLTAKFASAGPAEIGPGGIPRELGGGRGRAGREGRVHPEQALGPTYVPTHLGRAVLAHMVCPPLGLVAAILAGQVSLLERSGNIPGAWETSQRAKFWAHAGLGTAALVWGSVLALWVF